VLDDGRLTDGQGRTVDFKNTIIVMTSNIGVRAVKAGGQKGFVSGEVQDKYDEMRTKNEEAMKRQFNPEFLNRLDEIIVFRSLSKEHIFQIIDIQTKLLLKRLNAMDLSVEIDEAAKTFLAEKGYDEKYGARPLRRTIQRYIEDELADRMLRGELDAGSVVQISFDEAKNELTYTPKKGKAKRASKSKAKSDADTKDDGNDSGESEEQKAQAETKD